MIQSWNAENIEIANRDVSIPAYASWSPRPPISGLSPFILSGPTPSSLTLPYPHPTPNQRISFILPPFAVALKCTKLKYEDMGFARTGALKGKGGRRYISTQLEKAFS